RCPLTASPRTGHSLGLPRRRHSGYHFALREPSVRPLPSGRTATHGHHVAEDRQGLDRADVVRVLRADPRAGARTRGPTEGAVGPLPARDLLPTDAVRRPILRARTRARREIATVQKRGHDRGVAA